MNNPFDYIPRHFNNFTLRTKLIITFLVIALIPLGLSFLINNITTRAILVEQASQVLLARAEQTAVAVDALVNTNLATLNTEAKLAPIVDYAGSSPSLRRRSRVLESKLKDILEPLVLRNPEFITSYAVLDAQGMNIFDTDPSGVDVDESNRDYFQEALKTNSTYASVVQFSPTTGVPSLYFSHQIIDRNGKFVGVLRVAYDARILQELLKQNAEPDGQESFAALFDEHQMHLAHSTEPDAIFKLTGPIDPGVLAQLQASKRLPDVPIEELSLNLPDLQQNLLNVGEDSFFEARDVATGNRINRVAAISLKTQPWVVTFFQPQDVFLAPVKTQTRNTILLSVAISILVAISAVFVGQNLGRPITRLTSVAQQVAGGNLEVEVPIESQDEIGELAEAFNSMTIQLRETVRSLEDQVQERTSELVLSMEVGQQASTTRDLNALLSTITEFIRSKFDLYYVHIYMVDHLSQNLIIRSGTGTVGQQLLARHHNLPIGPGSIVGQVAAEGKTIVVPNTQHSDVHKPNPLLPNTKSEIAVPLVANDQVIGVLDLQDDKTETFTQHNMTVFEAMATQLVIAIDSAQQWTAAQEAQHQLKEVIRRLTRESWATTLAGRKKPLNFVYDLQEVKTVDSINVENGGVSVPVTVQNEAIGHLLIQPPVDRVLTANDHSLLAEVAQQLAQKAENLRLFEDTQRQATREHITRQIADKIRTSRDIETALKTAAEELSKALGTAKTTIDIRVETDDDNHKRELSE